MAAAVIAMAAVIAVVFDHPNINGPSPKDILRDSRDSANGENTCDNTHEPLNSTRTLPRNWRKFIACRKCKRHLVNFLSIYLLTLVRPSLKPNQWFIVAGGLDGDYTGRALGTNLDHQSVVAISNFTSNAEEADSRVWRHAQAYKKVLIYSPDTDTLHVGLPLSRTTRTIVQLDMPGAIQKRYLDLTALATCIQQDPDLQHITQDKRVKVMQYIYVATGCEYNTGSY